MRKLCFHSTTEKQIHFSIFHHDCKPEETTKQIKIEHRCNFKTTISECNLSFPSLKKLQTLTKLKNHPVKSKETPNQSEKVKYITNSSKGTMSNSKEYFSLQKSCNKTNESDKKCQEDNQEEEDEEICFLFNEEDCEGNAEESVWLQCGKCYFWAHVYCILHNEEQDVTKKMLTCTTEPWICQKCA